MKTATTALMQEPFEAMEIRQTREHLSRLHFIRDQIERVLGIRRSIAFRGGNDLVYIIHPNTREDRAKYPWQVTTFWEKDGELIPCSHTVHQHLDLEEDHGCYYKSAVWEIAWSITLPEQKGKATA